MLTIDDAFHLAYGRSITPEELAWYSNARAEPASSDLGLLRSVVFAFDRQSHPTPVTLRFGVAELETADFGSFKIVLDAGDISVGRPLLALHEHESHIRRFVETAVRPGMTAVDIGANVGFFTMLFASLVGPSGAVFAFEPNSENNRLILLSIDANKFTQIRLHPVALTERAGAVYFSPMIGSNGGLLADTVETLTHPNCIVVPCQRLDQVVDQRVDFIKADIEGAEYRALLGGIALIKRWRPVVISEFSMEMLSRVSNIGGSDFLKWMAGLGYTIHLIDRQDGGLIDISDIDAFLANWGNPGRIEDFAFLPAHSLRLSISSNVRRLVHSIGRGWPA
jgi:FkbM family methyltransferase